MQTFHEVEVFMTGAVNFRAGALVGFGVAVGFGVTAAPLKICSGIFEKLQSFTDVICLVPE